MKVYDKEGNERDKDPIDVRECVERLGWTTIPPESVKVVEESAPVVADPLSVAEIRGILDQRNVSYKSSTRKAQLLELLAESEPE